MLSAIKSQLLSIPFYNQYILIKKIERYIKSNGRENIIQDSYCHGLTLLWLYMAIEGETEENKFHQLIKKIIDCDMSELNKDKENIDKFIAHIEWLQTPQFYMENTHQIDIDTTLECYIDYQLSFHYNKDQLESVLTKLLLENKMFCICGDNHTVGVIARDGNYLFYDCNNIFGGTIKVNSITALKELIINALRTTAKPSQEISLTIIACSKRYVKMRLRQKCPIDRDNLIKESKNATNALFIASLDGDEEMVRKLIKNGVDINKRYPHEDNMSALGVAVVENRINIIEILLQKNADTNLLFSNNETALHYAAQCGHTDSVLLLLKYGANVSLKTKKNDTALIFALQNNDWATSAILFSCIKDIKDLTRKEIRYLRYSQNGMISALYTLESNLSKKMTSKSFDMFREICKGRWNLVNDLECQRGNKLFSESKIIRTEKNILTKSLKQLK